MARSDFPNCKFVFSHDGHFCGGGYPPPAAVGRSNVRLPPPPPPRRSRLPVGAGGDGPGPWACMRLRRRHRRNFSGGVEEKPSPSHVWRVRDAGPSPPQSQRPRTGMAGLRTLRVIPTHPPTHPPIPNTSFHGLWATSAKGNGDRDGPNTAPCPFTRDHKQTKQNKKPNSNKIKKK